jgi:hypothetical protein
LGESGKKWENTSETYLKNRENLFDPPENRFLCDNQGWGDI